MSRSGDPGPVPPGEHDDARASDRLGDDEVPAPAPDEDEDTRFWSAPPPLEDEPTQQWSWRELLEAQQPPSRPPAPQMEIAEAEHVEEEDAPEGKRPEQTRPPERPPPALRFPAPATPPPEPRQPQAGAVQDAEPTVVLPSLEEEEAAHSPDVEEFTFVPRPVGRTPAPSVPRYLPKSLSRRRFLTLHAFADALLPRGGPIPDSASDLAVGERIDGLLSTFDSGARRAFGRALTVVEWSTVFSRLLRPLSRLGPDARAIAVQRALRSKSTTRRTAAEAVKFHVANVWASSPTVEQAIQFTYSCVAEGAARASEPLEILSYPQVNRDQLEECDVVVVGSGAGGAVVAKEMAELGFSVVVVEEGGAFGRQDFSGPPYERMLRLYRKQGMTGTFGRPPVPVPMGSGVGGSTLVSAGTFLRPPERVLARWERETGIEGIDAESMRPYLERVERSQQVSPVPDALLGGNARVFLRGAEALGLHPVAAPRSIEGCRGCGVCSYGCPSDAKLSTHLTYLPRAQRHGATIYANARAERIVVEDGRARGIVASLLDPVTREPKARLAVRARLTVLAAGAVHTPALLARSALGNRSGQLGRNLRIHPSARVSALFAEEVLGWRGTFQPLVVQEYHEAQDVLIEATASVPSAGAGRLPGSGLELKELLGRYPYLASAIVFVADESTGRVIARNGNPLLTYSVGDADARRIVRAVSHTAEVLFAAGAQSVLLPIAGAPAVSDRGELERLANRAVRAGSLRLSGYHPVGTARMGLDPATSVVDAWGNVHGVEGLFVADASVLPGNPTVNPQLTVMAFVTRATEHIARHAARYFG